MSARISKGVCTGKGQRRRIVAALAITLAATLAVGAGDAIAGACKTTKRIAGTATDRVNVHTTVHSNTEIDNLKVLIRRDGVLIQSGTILSAANATGASSRMIGKLWADTKGGTFTVEVAPTQRPDDKSVCSYRILLLEDTTEWSLAKDPEAVCSGALNVSCEKSWHEGKERWNTAFVVSD